MTSAGEKSIPFSGLIPHLLAYEISNGSRGKLQREDLAEVIGEVTLRTQIAGASTLTVTVIDPVWALATSGFLETDEEGILIHEIEVQFPAGRYWRLCTVDITTDIGDPNLTLTFEDRIVAYLRDKWSPKVLHVADGTTTRAQFVKQLVDEVGRGDGLPPIKFVCPSLNVVQKVARSTTDAAGTTTITPTGTHSHAERRANKSRGIARGAPITIKGAAPTTTQLDLVNEVLDIANNLKAGTLATLALLEACIQENDFTNNPGGGGGSTGLLQLIPTTAAELGVDPLNVRQVVAAFLTKTQGGAPGGAMEYARTHPSASPDAVAQAVQASGAGASHYAQWEREARAILAAYGGLATGSQQSIDSLNAAIRSAPAKSDVLQLTRGTSDNPDEDSWDCINRLAQDVRWFAFSNADTLYYMDGPDLIAQTPRAFLALGRDAEPRWDLIDGDGKDPSATDCVAWLSGTVDNTTFVYRSTHRRKGKTRRAPRRVAKPSTPTEIQLSLVCDVDYAHAGDVFMLVDCGPLSGRWIVTDATRNCIADTFTQFTLGPPTAPAPEQQATDVGVTTPITTRTGTPSPGSATATSDGYYNPFAKARKLSPGRIDAGVDYTMTPGDEILCIGDSRAVGINANWYQSQPLLCMQFTSGPNNGEYWYIAEYIGNLPKIGSLVRAGDRLCTFGGSGSTGQQSIEIGWASPTSHIQVQTGGDSERMAGDNFARFLRSLGCPTVSIASGNTGSTHNPVGAAGH